MSSVFYVELKRFFPIIRWAQLFYYSNWVIIWNTDIYCYPIYILNLGCDQPLILCVLKCFGWYDRKKSFILINFIHGQQMSSQMLHVQVELFLTVFGEICDAFPFWFLLSFRVVLFFVLTIWETSYFDEKCLRARSWHFLALDCFINYRPTSTTLTRKMSLIWNESESKNEG